MRPSFRLGTFRGIEIGLHWSVALVAALFTFTLSGSFLPDAAPGFSTSAYLVVSLATAALFLGSIIAHELGHSIVARRNGIGIKGITLFALGGVAVMDREPDRAGPAFRIAIAGPLVSIGAGVASLGVAYAANLVGLSALSVAAIFWLGVINIGLAVFNMIPALPLDGGRVLHAGLWKRSGDQLRATVTAASVGRMLGTLMMLAGIYLFVTGDNGLWTAFIGWFVSSNAKAEEVRARRKLFHREVERTAREQRSDQTGVDGDVIDAEVVDAG